ncbi:30S ribosomal protein S16 [bacterium]|nr:MAG: 30S ribosomal protein S16 [bacterium]
MLKIRLTRRGKKNKAFFRLVVAEHASPIKGKFIEALGFLNPHTKEKSLKNERIKYWMEKGAQCSDSAHNMLVKEGILKGPKRAVKMKKKEEVKEEVKSEEKAAPEKKEEAKTEEKSVPEKEEKAEEPKTETPKEEKKAEQKEEKEPEKKKEEADPKGAEKEIVADEKK